MTSGSYYPSYNTGTLVSSGSYYPNSYMSGGSYMPTYNTGAGFLSSAAYAPTTTVISGGTGSLPVYGTNSYYPTNTGAYLTG